MDLEHQRDNSEVERRRRISDFLKGQTSIPPKAGIECEQNLVLCYNCRAARDIFRLETAQCEILDNCANEIKKLLDKVNTNNEYAQLEEVQQGNLPAFIGTTNYSLHQTSWKLMN
jgi:hypothetical protein